MSVVLVADLGGTSLRVGLVDRTGTILAARTISRRDERGQFQASEFDPQIWWQDFADAVEGLGKSARWVLLGETSSRSHARSVRALARKRQINSEAPQRATASRLVSTILRI